MLVAGLKLGRDWDQCFRDYYCITKQPPSEMHNLKSVLWPVDLARFYCMGVLTYSGVCVYMLTYTCLCMCKCLPHLLPSSAPPTHWRYWVISSALCYQHGTGALIKLANYVFIPQGGGFQLSFVTASIQPRPQQLLNNERPAPSFPGLPRP